MSGGLLPAGLSSQRRCDRRTSDKERERGTDRASTQDSSLKAPTAMHPLPALDPRHDVRLGIQIQRQDLLYRRQNLVLRLGLGRWGR